MQTKQPRLKSRLNNDLHIVNESKNTEITIEPENQVDKKKIKVDITGDSLLNSISEKGSSKNHQVRVQNFPGETTETILEEMDTLIQRSLIVSLLAKMI